MTVRFTADNILPMLTGAVPYSDICLDGLNALKLELHGYWQTLADEYGPEETKPVKLPYDREVRVKRARERLAGLMNRLAGVGWGSTEDEEWSVHLPEAARVARVAARQSPPAEADDIYQHLSLWLWQNSALVAEWEAERVAGTLYVEAMRYCNRERVDYMHFSGTYTYAPIEIRAALPLFFADVTDWHLHKPLQDAGTAKDGHDGQVIWHDPKTSDGETVMTDLSVGYSKLKDDKRAILYEAYGPGGSVTGLNAAQRKALQRAVDSLTLQVNFARKRVTSDASYDFDRKGSGDGITDY